MGIPLDHHNRWYQLAELIPWDDYEAIYASKLGQDGSRKSGEAVPDGVGNPDHPDQTWNLRPGAGPGRFRRIRISSTSSVCRAFGRKLHFDPSLITLFQKRIGNMTVDQINEDVVSKNHDLVMSAEDKLTGTGKQFQKRGWYQQPRRRTLWWYSRSFQYRWRRARDGRRRLR